MPFLSRWGSPCFTTTSPLTSQMQRRSFSPVKQADTVGCSLPCDCAVVEDAAGDFSGASSSGDLFLLRFEEEEDIEEEDFVVACADDDAPSFASEAVVAPSAETSLVSPCRGKARPQCFSAMKPIHYCSTTLAARPGEKKKPEHWERKTQLGLVLLAQWRGPLHPECNHLRSSTH